MIIQDESDDVVVGDYDDEEEDDGDDDDYEDDDDDDNDGENYYHYDDDDDGVDDDDAEEGGDDNDDVSQPIPVYPHRWYPPRVSVPLSHPGSSRYSTRNRGWGTGTVRGVFNIPPAIVLLMSLLLIAKRGRDRGREKG